jgi:L-seryl-tRNA(Ser) seleniumtransferase
MDVRPDTWPLRGRLLESGELPGPPHQGVGRGLKVGKEEIVGLLVALEEFVGRDDAAEQQQWQAILEELQAGMEGIPGLRCRLVPVDGSPRAYPYLRVDLDVARFGHGAVETVNRLQEGDPRICVSQWFIDEGALAFVPTELLPEHVPIIAERLATLAR